MCTHNYRAHTLPIQGFTDVTQRHIPAFAQLLHCYHTLTWLVTRPTLTHTHGALWVWPPRLIPRTASNTDLSFYSEVNLKLLSSLEITPKKATRNMSGKYRMTLHVCTCKCSTATHTHTHTPHTSRSLHHSGRIVCVHLRSCWNTICSEWACLLFDHAPPPTLGRAGPAHHPHTPQSIVSNTPCC